MLYVLYAFIAGAASAFAFEPVGWWPLLLVAFAVLCELIDRSKTVSRTPAHRLGVRPRPVRGRAQLDRDRIHLPGSDARLAGLGRGRPSVALPRHLSRSRRWPRLAVRPRQPGRARAGARRRVGDHRMAARNDVHRLPVEPGRGRPGADSADHGHSADRHLRSVRRSWSSSAARSGSNITGDGCRW